MPSHTNRPPVTRFSHCETAGSSLTSALAFAGAGAQVVVVDIDEVGGKETSALIGEAGGEATFVAADLTRADDVIATQLEIVDGRYTGTIEYYAYADEKARAITAMADERGYDLEGSFAYSDSITDLSMLEVVGHPHAVNPDKDLRRAAAERGWPILVFTRPVNLRNRLPAGRSALAALALGGVGAVGWVLWSSVRRRRASA